MDTNLTLVDDGRHIYSIDENNMRQGECFEYHHNGNLYRRLHFKDHLRHGNYEEWSINGALLETGQYSEGLCSGIWETFFCNMSTRTRYRCINNEAMGESVAYNINGDLMKRSYYLRHNDRHTEMFNVLNFTEEDKFQFSLEHGESYWLPSEVGEHNGR